MKLGRIVTMVIFTPYFSVMANSFFRFKQFTVYHNQCAMKVGTDGVLLGAWTKCDTSGNILDIGTGSGLIALMLAQRTRATINAIDIDKGAYEQAKLNFSESPFSDRLRIYHTSLQDFHPGNTYNLLVSNPPFFTNSLKSPDSQRNTARHDDSLSLDSLFSHARRLLSPDGRFCLIVPVKQEESINQIARKNQLHLKHKTIVFPTPNSKPRRTLLEYLPKQETYIEDQIIIEIARHQYSDEFKQLTKEYYL